MLAGTFWNRAAALYVLFIISSSLPISSLGLPWRRLELMRSPTCLMVTGGSQGITAGGGINWDSKLLLGFFTPSRGKGSVGGGGINCWDSLGLLYPWLRGKGGGIRMLGLILSVSRPPGLGLGNSTSSDLTADRSFQPTDKAGKDRSYQAKERFKGFWYLIVFMSLQRSSDMACHSRRETLGGKLS